MKVIKKYGPGLLLCLVIALPCWFLGQLVPVVGGPVFAILAGMVIALFYKKKTATQDGIGFTSKKILQFAVVLLGFGLNLSQIAQVGLTSLPIILATITTSLVVSFVLCKAMKVPGNISTLVGVGSSICGGSAIAATTILGYSAMSGAVGGGGLGKLAIMYGYNRYQTDIMFATVVLLIIIVQLLQSFGDWATRKSDKRSS